MKKKDIQNLLNMSLDKKTPKLTKKILSTPINTQDNSLPETDKKTSLSFGKNVAAAKNRKTIFTWVSVAASVLVIVIVASVCGVYFTNLSNQPVVTLETTCYEVDINPSVLITADKDGKVIHIAAQNEDADIVLSGKAFDNYTDMNAEECMQTFILESAKLGFIDCTSKDNKIKVSVISGEKSSKVNRLAKQTASNLQNYLKEIDIFGIVSATTYAVEEFVNGKGWQYVGDKIDSYLEDIENEFIYYRAGSIGGGALNDILSEVDAFVERLENINALLDRLDELNTEIENESGKNYWDCKLIEDSIIWGGSLSDNTKQLITQADEVRKQLLEYDITVSSILALDAYLIKYNIIEDIRNLLAEIKDGIAESVIINVILDYVNLIDSELYTKIKDELITLYNEVVAVLESLREERIEKFGSIFDSRPEISDNEYDEWFSTAS